MFTMIPLISGLLVALPICYSLAGLIDDLR